MQKLLFLDFETYYDQEYSLTKMAPPNYILDPRFETIGCAVKEDTGPSKWVDGPDFGNFIRSYNPLETTTVCFNALFDNCILAWHYGFVPARMLCTMRMSVALRGHVLSRHSLAKVGECLGVGTKGTTIESVRGMRRAEIMAQPALWKAFQDYANNDNEMNAAIFAGLTPEFPSSERRIMDRVIRCAVEPRFMIDTAMLQEHLNDLAADKVRMLRLAAGAKEEDLDSGGLALDDGPIQEEALRKFATLLCSSTKFGEALQSHGVDIDYKPSITDPTRMIPAFAKTDEFMAALLEHEDPAVQALAAARLGLRSTIEETRGKRLLDIARLPWDRYRDGSRRIYSGGTLPIPLKYSASHTHRLGGDWRYNMQNLPSGRGTKKSKLRKALVAPPGHKVVVADKAQIECRINAWLCGQDNLLRIFKAGGDPYAELAANIFGLPKVDKNVHKIERFIGKSGELGLGFGCGDVKFYNMVVRTARTLGMDIKELLKVWTPELAARSVDTYRRTRGAIVSTWRALDNILGSAWVGQTLPVKFGPCVIGHGYVGGPGGLKMRYGNPRYDPTTNEYLYDYGGRTFKIYGSKFLENIVQFLARIDTMHDALRISDRGYPFALQSHDELAWVVPDAKVAECQRIALEEMRRPPSWAPRLPLNAECSFGQSYGDAK